MYVSGILGMQPCKPALAVTGHNQRSIGSVLSAVGGLTEPQSRGQEPDFAQLLPISSISPSSTAWS